jgi:hypothetical protein
MATMWQLKTRLHRTMERAVEEQLDKMSDKQLERFRQMIADEDYVRRHLEK